MKTFVHFLIIVIVGGISFGLLFSDSKSQDVWVGWMFGLLYGGAVAFFLLPSIIARNKSHEHRKWIYLVNIIFGSTGIGWIISLLWAMEIIRLPKKKEITGTIREGVGTDDVISTISQHGEKISSAIIDSKESVTNSNPETSEFAQLEKIKKLHELHSLGAITQEEYNKEKAKLLL
jgi:hypothetical protein